MIVTELDKINEINNLYRNDNYDEEIIPIRII